MAEILNVDIARRLEDVVQLLKEPGANPNRVQASHRAATTRRWLGRPVTEMLPQEGVEGLRKLPGLGERLMRTIHDLVVTGRLPRLDRLRGEMDPVSRFASGPGIGTVLAEYLPCDLGIAMLEALASAAHDGRLAEIAGVGEKQLAGSIDSLATRLGCVRVLLRLPATDAPAVEERLDVDREYREQAALGTRRRIAPRRFNPSGEVWLPVWHTQRGERHYTARFSNPARAHQVGKTRDGVILDDDGNGEPPCTVITSQQGPLKGQRIVRGREAAWALYDQKPQGQPLASVTDRSVVSIMA